MSRLSAQKRANSRWASADKRRELPWPCDHCSSRAFASERGRNQHHLYCMENAQSKRFTEGGYDGHGEYEMLVNQHGRFAGVVWRGTNAIHGAAIKRDMRETMRLFGSPEPVQ